MKVRAKFYIESVTLSEHSDTVKMRAVYEGAAANAEDNTFAEATPSADVSMTVNNKAVRGFFKPGQKFYADFTLAG